MVAPSMTDRISDSSVIAGLANNLAGMDPTKASETVKASAALPTWSARSSVELGMVKNKGVTSYADADNALQKLLHAVGVGVQGINGSTQKDLPAKSTGLEGSTLAKLMDFPMDCLMTASANLCMRVLGDTVKATATATVQNTESQKKLNEAKVAKYQEQIDKAIEQQDKAKKAGIFGVILNWIMSIVEIVVGLFKMIEGAVRCAVGDVSGALDVVSGAAYFLAGLAGLVKAGAETAKLCGADPETCDKVSEVAGHVQMSFEMFGTAVDMFQVGQGLVAANAAAKGVSTGVSVVSAQLTTNIAAGSTTEVSKIAAKVGQEVAENTVQQISKALAQAGEKAVSKTGEAAASKIVQVFAKDALSKTIQSSIEHVAKQAIEKGIKLTAEELTSQITSAVRTSLCKAVLQAGTSTALTVTRAVVSSSNGITKGAVAIQNAELQKQIETLIKDCQFFEFCIEWANNNAQQNTDRIKEMLKLEAKVLSSTSQTLNASGDVQATIAGGMA